MAMQSMHDASGSSRGGATAGGQQDVDRRTVLCSTITAAALVLAGSRSPAEASKLPAGADKAWETLGGGPSDLTFPDAFEGRWDVTSTLTGVETPQGEDMVPDMAVVRRAQQEDLNVPMQYQVAFTRNRNGALVFDRAMNTASLLAPYYGVGVDEILPRITWDINDPNVLELTVPGGLNVRTRVTRRLQEQAAPDRLLTSEYFQQVFDSTEQAESQSSTPRVKASQCVTKYKWRPETAATAGQPSIVATQSVSDYLNSLSSDLETYLRAGDRPVVAYTYKISFLRASA